MERLWIHSVVRAQQHFGVLTFVHSEWERFAGPAVVKLGSDWVCVERARGIYGMNV